MEQPVKLEHGERCACTVCALARIYDGHTAESDAAAQRRMAREYPEAALAIARRRASLGADQRATATQQ